MSIAGKRRFLYTLMFRVQATFAMCYKHLVQLEFYCKVVALDGTLIMHRLRLAKV